MARSDEVTDGNPERPDTTPTESPDSPKVGMDDADKPEDAHVSPVDPRQPEAAPPGQLPVKADIGE